MCRIADFQHGFQRRTLVDNNGLKLKIKAFYVRLSGLKPLQPAPQYLSLLYLPRINEAELSVEGSKVRPNAAAFLKLHRIINAKTVDGGVIFGSRERVRASEGVRFEVYLGEERILDGSYRKDEEGDWALECKCGLEGGDAVVIDGADVAVAVEGQPALSERVKMAAKRNKSGGRGAFKFNNGLEAIPEDREEADNDLESGCSCDCGGGYDSDGDGGGDVEEACGPEYCRTMMETDLEGVRWAVDVGIWIVSLGMGFLVAKASSFKSFRSMRII